MCANFDTRLWWRRHQRTHSVLLLLLLFLQPTFIQTLHETLHENSFDYSRIKRNYNYANTTNMPERQASSEDSGVVHYFRFHDFEPRALSTYTWSASTSRPTVKVEGKSLSSEQSTNTFGKTVAEERKARGIHFEADGKDLAINLEFIIPFLRVPIARSVQITQAAFRKLADLNSDTLLLSSGFAIVGAIIAVVLKTVTTPTLLGYGYKKATRAADFRDDLNFASYAPAAEQSDTVTKSIIKGHDMLNDLEHNLYVNHINVSVCAQRAICSYVQQATTGMRAGLGSPTDRIVDGLISLDLLQNYLNGTALQNAIDTGREHADTSCELMYRDCEWPKLQNKAWEIAKKFLVRYFGRQL